MNRREILLGLGATLAAAKIPIPTELSVAPVVSNADLIAFLERVCEDIITRMCNPPYILFANGSMEQLSLENDQRALEIVNLKLRDLYATQD